MSRQTPATIWYTRCPVPTPLGLAAQLGLLENAFGKAGIVLESIIDSRDPEIRRSHFDHTLPWSFRHGGNVPPIRARSEGRSTRLAGITWTDEFQAIITLPSRKIGTTSELKGRRVGIARRPAGIVDFMAATALKGLESGLSLAGLSLDEVELVDITLETSVLEDRLAPSLFELNHRIPYGPEAAALIRGEIDAFFVKGTPGTAVANLIGAVALESFGFHPDPAIRINSGSPRLLTVDALLADERPDLVRLLIETLREASLWAEGHPDETVRFVARESRASEEQVLAANGTEVHRHLGLSLAPELLAAVSSYKDFLLRHGFLAGDFQIEDWADHRPWKGIPDPAPSGLAAGLAA
ncbi:desulfurase [Acetobacter senegalensis]|uniref:Desulfurase n=1 Tax=Acetobacter senegalensis TaxID=446692 RepID=A0A149TZ25_9PROT|nr:ABC transporter substrate-binding protein [Acetobacter senegalensis]KXV58356.1 desulfurase [Acetobacter senegalensis]